MWCVETMGGGQTSGRRAAYKDRAGVLWCARSDWLTSAVAAALIQRAPASTLKRAATTARAAQAPLDHNTLRAPHKKRVPRRRRTFSPSSRHPLPQTPHLTTPQFYHNRSFSHHPLHPHPDTMPPKAAQKTPSTGGKAPAGKAPAEKKEAGKKTAAPSGDKKKRTKSRKETYSSYIYKGEFALRIASVAFLRNSNASQSSSRSTPTLVSPTAPCPS